MCGSLACDQWWFFDLLLVPLVVVGACYFLHHLALQNFSLRTKISSLNFLFRCAWNILAIDLASQTVQVSFIMLFLYWRQYGFLLSDAFWGACKFPMLFALHRRFSQLKSYGFCMMWSSLVCLFVWMWMCLHRLLIINLLLFLVIFSSVGYLWLDFQTKCNWLCEWVQPIEN